MKREEGKQNIMKELERKGDDRGRREWEKHAIRKGVIWLLPYAFGLGRIRNQRLEA
jgi:hypothetical protein